MITFQQNVSLKPYNSFGIDVSTLYFVRITTLNDLFELLSTDLFKQEKHLILGGGSNLLFTANYNGIVIKNELKGIEIVNEDDDKIDLKVMSGECWHDFVMHCVQNNWGGIENLSLIPGTLGAAPMQNIGAYGVEVKDVIKRVEGIDLKTGIVRSLEHDECRFGYRESIFKSALKEFFFISSVTLSLTKKNHLLNTEYGAIRDTLQAMKVTQPTLRSVSDAVIQIRRSKLPDPIQIGNAGSFFKNPSVPKKVYEQLKISYPTMPGYSTVNQEVKVPAGWLIEQCGWKGKKINQVGVHAQQALVLVNYGEAKGDEIFSLAKKISVSVEEKFHITLTPEVNIVS